MKNTLSKVCPFIRRIPNQGGMMVTFPSAAEDLTLSFTETSNRKFKFSKFALVNIPDILNRQYENTLKLEAIPGAYTSYNYTRTTDNNVHFAESFQNYCLNLETMIISDTDYNSNLPLTVSERVFFKWLKEMGGVRFQEKSISGLTDARFTEEVEHTNYNRVIQYIGDIDFVNNINGSTNSYTEVYVHVPTEVGNIPDVLFKTVEDANYAPGMTFCKTTEGLNNEIIAGRSYDDVHPDNLDIHAFYDNDSGLLSSDGTQSYDPLYENITGIELYKKIDGKLDKDDDILTDYVKNSWWYYRNSDSNCYHLQPDTFIDSTNESLAIFNTGLYGIDTNINDNALKFKRSNLDGISIDFDAKSYSKSTNNSSINSLIDVARTDNAKDFKFNAILIYYDLFTENITETTVTQNTLATNLFGILFLDNLQPTSLGGAYIPRFEKCRPNSVFHLNGNSYGFKINMKLNISPITSGVEVEHVISDSNTLSMDIYSDALKEMFSLSQSLIDININLLSIDNRIRFVEELNGVSKQTMIQTLSDRITTLEAQLVDMNLITPVYEKEDIFNMLSDLYTKYNSLLSGTGISKIAFDFGTLKGGTGIELDTDSQNLIIKSTNQEYNYSDKMNIYNNSWKLENGLNPNEKFVVTDVSLVELKNYVRFTDNSVQKYSPNTSFKFFIKDNIVQWSKGQTMRLYWDIEYDLVGTTSSTKYFYIYTDYNNILKQPTNYSGLIAQIPSKEFIIRKNKPVIEIHCINPLTMKFFVDFIN